MKAVLVLENKKVRLLETNSKEKKTVEASALALRSRLTSGDIKYYELDYEEIEGITLDGYVAAINKYPDLLELSDKIKRI